MDDGHELSGWRRRGAAAVIDALLISAVASLLLWAFGFDFGEYFAADVPLLLTTSTTDIVFLLACAGVALPYYLPMMVAWDGRTIGKRALGIRVVRTGGKPMDVGTVLVRQVIVQSLVLAFLPLVALANYLLPLADRENRAGHDLVARTRVVRERR